MTVAFNRQTSALAVVAVSIGVFFGAFAPWRFIILATILAIFFIKTSWSNKHDALPDCNGKECKDEKAIFLVELGTATMWLFMAIMYIKIHFPQITAFIEYYLGWLGTSLRL